MPERAFDEEMRERIEQHRAERGDGWQTSEAPIALAETIRRASAPDRVVLVDCLTLWLSNILLAECDPDTEAAALAECIATSAGPLILVSNEVGHGIVPATPLGRRFRDAQGRLNQQVAAACDAVVFVAAGCPTLLKPVPTLDLTLA